MTIFSRAHTMCENVEVKSGEHLAHPFLQDLITWPSFVVQADAFELLKRADCANAIQALVDADIFKLPQPKMAIEFCVREANYSSEFARAKMTSPDSSVQSLHEFVLLEELPSGSIRMRYAFLYTRDRIGGIGEFYVDVKPFKKNLVDLTDIPRYSPDGFHASESGDGFLFEYSEANIDPSVKFTATEALLMSINIAFVLMNMKGIDREIHSNEPLNKSRAKKGKPRIVNYTYLRIGHVYNRDGTRVKYIEGSNIKSMHVRTAHTRRQHFGKNNEETKIIYVPSCIVNFVPNGEITKPKPKIVRA